MNDHGGDGAEHKREAAEERAEDRQNKHYRDEQHEQQRAAHEPPCNSVYQREASLGWRGPHSHLHREALAMFERQVLEGVIRHVGDSVIAEQLAGRPLTDLNNGDPRRLRKLERSRPIDVSVALALAVWRVVHGGDTRSVYATRGLIAV